MEKTGLYLLLLIGAANSLSDIVTLRKKNKILCITKEVTLPTFISPPFIENSIKSLSLLNGEDWSYDNWTLTDGSKSLLGSVTDKRWENFEVIKTNYKRFTPVQSVSFSLHSPEKVEMTISDDQKLYENYIKVQKNGWNHISFLIRNNSLFYLLNNKVIKREDGFHPHQIIVKTKNDIFWKIHNYQFMMSETVTHGKHTTLKLPHTGNSCFLLYLSLCEKCLLAIPELNRVYISTNYPSFLNSWQVYHIETEPGTKKLSFFKTKTDNSMLGYWGIDLHECPTSDIVSYKVNPSETDENNYLCNILNREYKMERLTEPKKKTMNVELCEDPNCKCIWGYTDTYHHTSELSQKDCKRACKLCKKLTIEDPVAAFKNGNRGLNLNITLIVITVLITLSLFVTLVGYVYYYKRYRQKNNNDNKIDTMEKIMLMIVPSEENGATGTNIKIEFLESYLKKTMVSIKQIETQFSSFQETPTKSCAVGLESRNINKNKDKSYIPYDATRVILQPLEGMGTDDYINATYINGYDRSKTYISCQEPKFYTIKDFWRLIWQVEIETIVMATNFIENKKRMCAEYWPQKLNTLFECGEMTIKLVQQENYEYHDVRVFQIYYMRHCRRIKHLQLRWDTDTTLYPNVVVPVVKYIRQITENSVVLIHSGFGVNRTGILILCDLALAMASAENEVNFYALMNHMREQRPYMVNKMEHYLLTHLIVLECLMELETPFKKSLADNFDNNVIKQQLSYLTRFSWHDKLVKSWNPKSPTPKNNLPSPTYVDGYKRNKKYLVMQQPQKEMSSRFWNVVVENKISHILFLNKLRKNII
ncbi:receptor-type tyrosine-protein phosphatase alpha-like isoform X3 [Tenebrio molitor]|uniref:receptor-type tyrosine-protein phosphatase alpha-like isoform X3 n=1 Tax=Tenebrio molitor TaxID=7067 RepID=UPI0036247C29